MSQILAYVDPGAGTLLFQMAAAAVVGMAFYIKKTRDWLFGLFRRSNRKK